VSVADMQKSKNAPVKLNQRKNTMYGTEVYSTTIFFVEPGSSDILLDYKVLLPVLKY